MYTQLTDILGAPESLESIITLIQMAIQKGPVQLGVIYDSLATNRKQGGLPVRAPFAHQTRNGRLGVFTIYFLCIVHIYQICCRVLYAFILNMKQLRKNVLYLNILANLKRKNKIFSVVNKEPRWVYLSEPVIPKNLMQINSV
jgi:hypothetical protein